MGSTDPALDEYERTVGRLRAAGCVFAEDEARLILAAGGDSATRAGLVDRRCAGEPLEYLLGWAEFCGLRIAVSPGVFVPRQRTSLLVRAAWARLRPGAVLVDMCCGSGAIGVAVAHDGDCARIVFADCDPAAVACARDNAASVGGEVYCGDLFSALPDDLRGRIDVLTANVPYVPIEAIAGLPPEARDHEPIVTLDGGADGLAVARRLVTDGADWLATGGHLAFEVHEDQAAAAVELTTNAGLSTETETDDDWGTVVVIGRK